MICREFCFSRNIAERVVELYVNSQLITVTGYFCPSAEELEDG
jgi:hypothetical protein